MQAYPSPSLETTQNQAHVSQETSMTVPAAQYQPLTPPEIRASVGHLLSRALSMPCSTAASAFNQLAQPTARFQLALDALLPILDSNAGVEVRISVHLLRSWTNAYRVFRVAACPTDTRFFHSILALCTLPRHCQPLQVSPLGHVRQRARKSRRSVAGRRHEPQRAIRLGSLEDFEGRRQ